MINTNNEFNNCCFPFDGSFYNYTDNKGKGGGGDAVDIEINPEPTPDEKTRQEEISDMLSNANKNLNIFTSVFGEFVKQRENYINPQQGLDDEVEKNNDEGKKDPKKEDDNTTRNTILIAGGALVAVGALVYFVFIRK